MNNELDGWQIVCKCGYSDDVDLFYQYDSPDDNPHYQCPDCGIEWNIRDNRAEQKRKEEARWANVY